MKVYELVDKVKKSASAENIESDMLYEAIASLEGRIEKKAEIPERDFNKDNVLYACGGGVSDGYTDMYSAYLDREACRIREDWKCFDVYDAIFTTRYRELCREIIRNRKPKRFSFK